MAPQVGLEPPCKRNYNNLAGSRWHVLPAFRWEDLGTARKWHGDHESAKILLKTVFHATLKV